MDTHTAACKIRDHFMDPTTKHRVGEHYGSGAKKIELQRYYFGLIYTPFNPYCASWARPGEDDSPELAARLPYMLSVWFNGGPNLMKIRWKDDEAHVLMMQRGAWESDFGLPPYKGPTELELWRWEPRQLHTSRA